MYKNRPNTLFYSVGPAFDLTNYEVGHNYKLEGLYDKATIMEIKPTGMSICFDQGIRNCSTCENNMTCPISLYKSKER
jgi:hypothetical protein